MEMQDFQEDLLAFYFHGELVTCDLFFGGERFLVYCPVRRSPFVRHYMITVCCIIGLMCLVGSSYHKKKRKGGHGLGDYMWGTGWGECLCIVSDWNGGGGSKPSCGPLSWWGKHVTLSVLGVFMHHELGKRICEILSDGYRHFKMAA